MLISDPDRLQAQFDSSHNDHCSEDWIGVNVSKTSLDFVDAASCQASATENCGSGGLTAGLPVVSSVPPDEDTDFALAVRLQEEEDQRSKSTFSLESASGRSYQQFNEHNSNQANNEYTSQKLGPRVGFRHLKADVTGDNTFNAENIERDSIRVEDGRYIHWDGHNHRDQDNMIVTKHDAKISATQRINRLNNLYGDAVGDLQQGTTISSQAYNSIKEQLRRETKKGIRAHAGKVEAEKQKTRQGVLDQRTQRLILKIINSGLVDQLTGIIKTGKEANVYHAIGQVNMPQPKGFNASSDILGEKLLGNVAVKIFKTTLSDFKNRVEYIEGDPRYAKLDVLKMGDWKLIKLWAEKEWRNLQRMRSAGILCPAPLMLREHILVMSFIGGENGHPAPQLAQAASRMSGSDLRGCYLEIVIAMRQLYQKCSLVHADLSECNILYQQEEGKIYMIDVGQAVESSHPKADFYLARDAHQVTKFFHRKGIYNALPWPVLCQFVVETDQVLSSEEYQLEMEHSLLKLLQNSLEEDVGNCELGESLPNSCGLNESLPSDNWRKLGAGVDPPGLFRSAILQLRAEHDTRNTTQHTTSQ